MGPRQEATIPRATIARNNRLICPPLSSRLRSLNSLASFGEARRSATGAKAARSAQSRSARIRLAGLYGRFYNRAHLSAVTSLEVSVAKTFSFPLMMAILLAVTATVSTQQFQPGYVDPRPVLEAAAKAIGTDNLKCVTISGTALRRRRRPAARVGKNVDWPRIDSLANYTRTMNWEAEDDEGGVRPQARAEPGVVEVRRRLARRPAAAEPAPDLHGQRQVTPGTWTAPAAPPVASPPDVAEIYPARAVAEPARLPQGGADAGREPEGGLALGARRDGPRRSRGAAGEDDASSRSP